MRLSAVAELSPEIIARLEEQGIKTDSDFLSLTGVEILRKLPHGTSTLGQIHDFKTIVARVSSAPGVSARIRLDSTPVSFSGDDASCPASLGLISLALAPYSGRVVEVSGTANSRKSEFILNVVLRNLSSNEQMSAYWVDTTGELVADQASDIASRISEDGEYAFLERIRWSPVLEVEQIYDILEEITSFAKVDTGPQGGTGYLVIDRITSLLGPLLSTSSSQGYVWMSEMMHHLRALAQAHSITILVINEGTSKPVGTQGLHKSPALGTTFAFLTDATIWISMDPHHKTSGYPDSTGYYLEVLKSNFMTSKASETFVLESGLHLLLET